MKFFRIFLPLFIAAVAAAPAADWLDPYLAVSAFHGNVRARLSGMVDLEAYYIEQPAPGVIYTDNRDLVNPRLTLFLDVQFGSKVYGFVQARVDRGFDPSESDAEARLDEWALRFTPWDDGRFTVQAGRFGTVIGNWVPRHDSWDNPFVTAPMPYENMTAIWDRRAPYDADTLIYWGHVPPSYTDFGSYEDKFARNPLVWGPSYATGASVSGRIGKVEYAAEIKNTALSSRPEAWDTNEMGFDDPTFNVRFGFRPNPTWNFGVSASEGTFLLPEANPSLAPGSDLNDYRQLLLAQDVSFERHQLQVWAEFFQVRFEIPGIGDADTFSYYLEAKYKFTTRLYAALRWNQQFYDTIRDTAGHDTPWGNDLWRVDAALGFRPTPNTQLKLQYSIEHDEADPSEYSHNFAGQVTVKF